MDPESGVNGVVKSSVIMLKVNGYDKTWLNAFFTIKPISSVINTDQTSSDSLDKTKTNSLHKNYLKVFSVQK